MISIVVFPHVLPRWISKAPCHNRRFLASVGGSRRRGLAVWGVFKTCWGYHWYHQNRQSSMFGIFFMRNPVVYLGSQLKRNHQTGCIGKTLPTTMMPYWCREELGDPVGNGLFFRIKASVSGCWWFWPMPWGM